MEPFDISEVEKKAIDKADSEFTEQEYRFVEEIDKSDISENKFKDHFPVDMTNLQIMDASIEAYKNTEKRVRQHEEKDDGSFLVPDKGQSFIGVKSFPVGV